MDGTEGGMIENKRQGNDLCRLFNSQCIVHVVEWKDLKSLRHTVGKVEISSLSRS